MTVTTEGLTPDREGWPSRIPEYVFETAAQAASFPAVTAAKPWFRAAVESAFMNGREDAARDIEDAMDAARGTIRRGALRAAVRLARGDTR